MVLHELLCLPEREKHVVSLCGGGGKTTLLYALAKECSMDARVIVCTSTRILPPDGLPLLLGADAGREAAAQGMEAALMRLGMPLCRVLPFRRKLTAP